MADLITAPAGVRVPLVDLRAEYDLLRQEGLEQAITAALAEAHYVEGPAVRRFEQAFAKYCGVAECVAVDSGTAALHLALVALGIGPGDEVIVPAYTFIATASAVMMAGATPRFIDAESRHWQMDLDQVEAAAGVRAKAVIAVHLFGQPLPIQQLASLCAAKGLHLIEDAAQAQGACFHGRRAGSFGELNCFSFYPTKNLGAFGDGGALTTGNRQLAERLRRLRNHGRLDRYQHAEIGYNYRMDELQGVALEWKLRHLETWNARRRRIAEQYRTRLAGLSLWIPEEVEGSLPVYHLFPVGHPQRDRMAEFLAARQIETAVHYPLPLPLQPAFRNLGLKAEQFPVAAKISRQTLSLPIYPFMSDQQLDHVCASVAAFCKGSA